MKKLFLFALISLISLSITACESVNDLLTQEVPFTKTFTRDIVNEKLPQSKEDCANLTEDKTFNDNKDMLDGVTFVSLKVSLSNYDPLNVPPVESGIVESISFAIKFAGESTSNPLETVSNVPISELINGKTITLGSKYDDLASKIKINPNFCLISNYGNITGVPNNKISATINLELKMGLKVKI